MFDIELIDFENKYTSRTLFDVFANVMKTPSDGWMVEIQDKTLSCILKRFYKGPIDFSYFVHLYDILHFLKDF